MWPIDQIVCLGILSALSVLDIVRRRISAALLAVLGLGVLLYQGFTRQTDGWLILGGGLTGLGFLLFSRVTKEGLGYGDSLLILILGLYLGLWRLLGALTVTFFLLFLVDLPLLAIKKMSRKYSLPFYPFLAGGCLALFISEGGVL